MAWIGLVDEKTSKVNPIATAGQDDGYLSIIKTISTKDVLRGPAGTAIRNNKFVVCNDIATAPSMKPWKKRHKRDYKSVITLPIRRRVRNRCFYTLCNRKFFLILKR
jgi:hypothetical protein